MNTTTFLEDKPEISESVFQQIKPEGISNFIVAVESRTSAIRHKIADMGLPYFQADIDHFRKTGYVSKTHFKTDDDLILELLMIGVYWNHFQGRWRWHLQLVSPFLKTMNSVNYLLFKSAPSRSQQRLLGRILNRRSNRSLEFDIDQLVNLYRWLAASGGFGRDLKAIDRWIQYLYLDIKRNSIDFLEEVSSFANWFESYLIKQADCPFENGLAFFGKEDVVIADNKQAQERSEPQFTSLAASFAS